MLDDVHCDTFSMSDDDANKKVANFLNHIQWMFADVMLPLDHVLTPSASLCQSLSGFDMGP
jgi:hypothetical protein